MLNRLTLSAFRYILLPGRLMGRKLATSTFSIRLEDTAIMSVRIAGHTSEEVREILATLYVGK